MAAPCPQIHEVWASNLHAAFAIIRDLVDDRPYVAMDTEFPGVIVRPVVPDGASASFYSSLKANVDLLKPIQLGLTFADKDFRKPPVAFQFNFRDFDPDRDFFAADSIALLRQSGIDFDKFVRLGVDTWEFAELFMSSGVVLNDSVHWITFSSGYDFGYLLKILTCRDLPKSEEGFFALMKTYFRTVYDIKYLMRFCNSLHGGLDRLAELLELERIGEAHQAGSDSLLTAFAYRKLRQCFFNNGSPEKHEGVLYGLGVDSGEK
ncbi:putative CCR4-associated factor 1-like protein 7 [Iris pallida]|uniref:poly(A)-specific ribonuclease n=1 Tax=Iris pallida TaxID=29817 RepID=A0AAX6GLE7_IRIPA|nr:putative CCR4-associated factor 1-like protein 7 [Iris pallida]KAJ6849791.1 putative CCR4-associated factor 1-like protein 7 [Iris pallida]